MNILLADDHPMIREGVKAALLANLDPDVRVLEAWDAATLWDTARAHLDLDLALIDLNMPGMCGAESIAELRNQFPALPVIVMSGIEDRAQVEAILNVGASGYIPKSASPELAACAIRVVMAGGRYLPSLLLGEPAPSLHAASPVSAIAHLADGQPPCLSQRHCEIMVLVELGLTNKEIARDLGISTSTVGAHLQRIFDLLGEKTRTGAVNAARKLLGPAWAPLVAQVLGRRHSKSAG